MKPMIPKGQENKIYTIVKGRETFYRRHTVPVKFVTWKIGPVTLYGIFFCLIFCYAFVRVCLLIPCGHLLGKGWPLGSRLWCLIVKLSFPLVSWVRCGAWVYRFLIFALFLTFMCFLVTTSVIFFTLCITQSLNIQIHFRLLYSIASFCI